MLLLEGPLVFPCHDSSSTHFECGDFEEAATADLLTHTRSLVQDIANFPILFFGSFIIGHVFPAVF